MAIKDKIKKTVDEMSEDQLKSVWLVIKEIANQKKSIPIGVEKKFLDDQIAKGIKQLEDGEGVEFGNFVNDMELKYGNK